VGMDEAIAIAAATEMLALMAAPLLA